MYTRFSCPKYRERNPLMEGMLEGGRAQRAAQALRPVRIAARQASGRPAWSWWFGLAVHCTRNEAR